ncbi:hypothetical protein CHUAL_012240 [Chamberlinius hualienensis]
MPCWYYDKKDLRTTTPSFQDGLDPDVEARYRKEGARFISKICEKMGLRYYETLATGTVYFHRFYMIHSFKQFPRYVTACCCLFLAGKVEETPKKCKDIIKAARSLLNDQQFAQFGEDPKEEVMTLERILLQTMKFDLQVDHPYKYLLRYAKCLRGDKQKLQAMVQMSWTFVNDSLHTTLCLQWEPEIVAIALMYLSSKLTKFEVTDWNGRTSKHQRWWDMYVEDISIELLEDVCHQVLDLYSNSSKLDSSPPLTPPPSTNQGLPPTPLPMDQHIQPSQQQKKPKPTTPTMPHGATTQARPPLPMESVPMDLQMIDPGVPPSSVQGHLISGPSDSTSHLGVMHGYKYPPMPGMPEGFVPPPYASAAGAPYASFGEIPMPNQTVMDGAYPSGYYETSAFPPGYVNSVPPGGAPMSAPYPGPVPLHYMSEPLPGSYPHQGGPAPPFPAGVYPSVYPPPPPPTYGTSPVPPPPVPGSGRGVVHQGIPRGGVAPRLQGRQGSHPGWGI